MKLIEHDDAFYVVDDPVEYDRVDAERIFALMIHLDDYDPRSFTVKGNIVSYCNQEWLVVTDDEADDLWDKDLESCLDDCVPGSDHPYFDRERWKNDARIDGRAHSLNRYDGSEHYEEVNDTTYYLYRQN